MRAGRLRHRVRMWRKTVTDNGDGSYTETWVDLGFTYGAVEPVKGREALMGGGVLAEMDTRIVLRHDKRAASLVARDRLEYPRGTLYNVTSIAETRLAQREIEFMVKSGVNAG